MSPQSQALDPDAVIVGIDGTDAEHVVCRPDSHGCVRIETLMHSPEAIDEWAADLQQRFPVRALAFKGLRILFRCWKPRTLNDKDRDLPQLQ